MVYEIKELNNKKYITFPLMTQLGLENAFTTSDMDFRLREGLSKDSFKNDYRILKEATNSLNKILFSSSQIHNDNIALVQDLNDGVPYENGRELEDTDGLITDLTGAILKTVYADCTPVLIFDPVKKVQGSIHSGWSGTTLKISSKAINLMIENYGSCPSDIVVIIGPSIGKEFFEVEKDVLSIFQKKFPYWQNYTVKKNEIKYLININGIIKESLLSSGLSPENIYNCELNTYNNPLFHSHRYDGLHAGRMIMLSSIK